MPLTSAVPVWNLVMPLGAAQVWNFVFTQTANGQPYPITGSAWEYVARTAAGAELFTLTTSAGSNGLLTVTTTSALSQVQMDLYPAATQDLSPGQYLHALWQNPGTDGAYPWFSGSLQIAEAAQP